MMQIAVLAAILLSPPPVTERPVATMGECDPKDGSKPHRWTKELREETRARVRAACKAHKAAPIVCAMADAVVIRESSGRAGVRHFLGSNENGLGAMGTSLRWHHDKWPGKDEDPMFCQPEVAFEVSHAIWWRAVTRYHAEDAVDMQAIFAGKWSCWMEYDPKRKRERKTCRAAPTRRTIKSICGRMKMRGFSCRKKISKKDLGIRVRRRDRRAWAASVAAGEDPTVTVLP